MSTQELENEILIHRPQNPTIEEPSFARDAPSQSKVCLMNSSSFLLLAMALGDPIYDPIDCGNLNIPSAVQK